MDQTSVLNGAAWRAQNQSLDFLRDDNPQSFAIGHAWAIAALVECCPDLQQLAILPLGPTTRSSLSPYCQVDAVQDKPPPRRRGCSEVQPHAKIGCVVHQS